VISAESMVSARQHFLTGEPNGMSPSQPMCLKEIEKENAQLKKMYADLSLVY